MIEFSIPPALVIAIVVSVIIPAIVGLVTQHVTAPAVKGVLLTVLSLAVGVLSELGTAITNGVPYDLGVGLLTAVLSLAAAQSTYSAFYKPTGLADRLQAIGGKHAA